MQREFSAGGVVLRRMRGGWFLAAIEPEKRENSAKKKTLALPKGWVEEGETPEAAAQREVEEETGLRVERIAKLGDIKYVYVRHWSDKERVFKIVSFYLFRYLGGTLGDIADNMRHEVRSAQWLPLEDAPKALSYGGERDMVKEAARYLRKNSKLSSE